MPNSSHDSVTVNLPVPAKSNESMLLLHGSDLYPGHSPKSVTHVPGQCVTYVSGSYLLRSCSPVLHTRLNLRLNTRMRRAVLLLLSTLPAVLSAQESNVVRSDDDRLWGKTACSASAADSETGLMQGLELLVEWWTLLGQAVEFYGVKWSSTGQFTVNLDLNRVTIRRGHLEKYPDLLKRFDNLQPLRMDLVVYGSLAGKSVSVERGSVPANADFMKQGNFFKRDGKAYDQWSVSAGMVYEIPDVKLLYTRAGVRGDDLLPRSPQNWNDFWQWTGSSVNDPDMVFSSINLPPAEFKKLSRQNQNALENQLKTLFDQVTQMSLQVRIRRLEWPQNELVAIARLYADYESGAKNPSPDELAQKELREMGTLQRYASNDEWSRAEVIESTGFDIVEQKGKQGVVSRSGQVLIPFRDWKIHTFKSGKARVTVEKTRSDASSCLPITIIERETGLVDSGGNWAGDPVKSVGANYIEPYYVDSSPLTLKVTREGETPRPKSEAEKREERERKAEEKRRKEQERRQCRERTSERMREILNDYRMRGYAVDE